MEGPFNSIFTWNYDNSPFKSILIQFLKKTINVPRRFYRQKKNYAPSLREA